MIITKQINTTSSILRISDLYRAVTHLMLLYKLQKSHLGKGPKVDQNILHTHTCTHARMHAHKYIYIYMYIVEYIVSFYESTPFTIE